MGGNESMNEGTGIIVTCIGPSQEAAPRPLLVAIDGVGRLSGPVSWLDHDTATDVGWSPADDAPIVGVDFLAVDGTWMLDTRDVAGELTYFRQTANREKILTSKNGVLSLQAVPNSPRTAIEPGFFVWPPSTQGTSKWPELVAGRYDIAQFSVGATTSGMVLPNPTDDLESVLEDMEQALVASLGSHSGKGVKKEGEWKRAPDETFAAYNERQNDATSFINPYNFVSLPDATPRSEPPGHHVLGEGRLRGRIEVEWVAASPLLFGVGSNSMLEEDAERPGHFTVSGSSLKGAVRSLHESLRRLVHPRLPRTDGRPPPTAARCDHRSRLARESRQGDALRRSRLALRRCPTPCAGTRTTQPHHWRCSSPLTRMSSVPGPVPTQRGDPRNRHLHRNQHRPGCQPARPATASR
jgi:hypothetical protein